MKKLLSAALVALATMATSAPVMAHSGDIVALDYPIWNFNFGAQASGSSYKGPGVIYTSENGADGANNFWNYYGGTEGGVTNVDNAQAYDAIFDSSGSITVSAPYTHKESALNFSGYISSDGSTPITITTDVYGFGLTTGHAYVYTEQGETAAILHGISGLSTATPSVSYTWYETSTGITYDVQEYFVTSNVTDSMSFTATGGQINALQLTPIPPHPIPEPGTVALLGIGGLAGLTMRKRRYFAEA